MYILVNATGYDRYTAKQVTEDPDMIAVVSIANKFMSEVMLSEGMSEFFGKYAAKSMCCEGMPFRAMFVNDLLKTHPLPETVRKWGDTSPLHLYTEDDLKELGLSGLCLLDVDSKLTATVSVKGFSLKGTVDNGLPHYDKIIVEADHIHFPDKVVIYSTVRPLTPSKN